MLAAGPQPLFWHAFDLPPATRTTAILAANSTLWMLGRHSRITLPIDTVIVHGRPELTLTQDPEAFRQRTGARLIRCAEPDYDLGRRRPGGRPGQLPGRRHRARPGTRLKPAVSIREIFPWGELGLHGALLGAVSLFLIGTAAEANARLQAVGTELSAFSWLKKQDQAKLDAEKKALAGTVESRRKRFGAAESTGPWCCERRGRGAREHRPSPALSGDAEVGTTSKAASGKGKKQLIMNFATPMSEDGSVPREIDGFLAALRGEPTLKRLFPLIEITGLRANPAKTGPSVRLLQRRLFAQGGNDKTPAGNLAGDYPRAIFPMDEKTAKTDYKQVMLEQLRQPLKLRLLLCVAIIAGWYVAVLQPPERTDGRHHSPGSPGSANGSPPRARSSSSRRPWCPIKGRIPAGADVNELMRHVDRPHPIVTAEAARPEARKAQGSRSLSRRWASS